MRDVLALLWQPSARGRLVLACFLGTVVSLSMIGLLGLSGWFITAAGLAGLSGAVGFGFLNPSGGVRAFALGRIIARTGERLTGHQLTLAWQSRLRAATFGRLLHAPFLTLSALHSAEVLGRLMSDIDDLDLVPMRVLIPSVGAWGACLITLIWLALTQPTLLWPATLAMVAIGGVLPLAMAWWGQRPGQALLTSRAAIRSTGIEAVTGFREIVAYEAGDQVRAQLQTSVQTIDHLHARVSWLDAWQFGLVETLTGGATLGALVLALSLAISGQISVPLAVGGVLVVLALAECVATLPGAYLHLGRAWAAARRVSALGQAESPAGNRSFPQDATLRVKHVTVFYPSAPHHPLMMPDVTLAPGAVVWVCGPSGSGKTTLLRVLAREIAPLSGQVTIGGVPLSSIEENAWHTKVTFVGQDSHVFMGTVRQNLLLAHPQASEAEMRKALDCVQLSAWLSRLPQDLDTWLGEDGERISGGQRRRLCIARALLRQPDILILDEPTVGLDAETATQMLQDIHNTHPASTIVLASHNSLAWLQREATVVVPLDTFCGSSPSRVAVLPWHGHGWGGRW